mgnify:CR=1 FL=1
MSTFNFKTTQEINVSKNIIDQIIGQDNAISKLKKAVFLPCFSKRSFIKSIRVVLPAWRGPTKRVIAFSCKWSISFGNIFLN